MKDGRSRITFAERIVAGLVLLQFCGAAIPLLLFPKFLGWWAEIPWISAILSFRLTACGIACALYVEGWVLVIRGVKEASAPLPVTHRLRCALRDLMGKK